MSDATLAVPTLDPGNYEVDEVLLFDHLDWTAPWPSTLVVTHDGWRLVLRVPRQSYDLPKDSFGVLAQLVDGRLVGGTVLAHLYDDSPHDDLVRIILVGRGPLEVAA